MAVLALLPVIVKIKEKWENGQMAEILGQNDKNKKRLKTKIREEREDDFAIFKKEEWVFRLQE